WRHGFHLGVRLPHVLPPRQRHRARARQSVVLGRHADRPHAEKERGLKSSCPGRGAASVTLLRRAGTHGSSLVDPGSAAHRKSAAQHPGNVERERTNMNFDDTPQEAAFRSQAKAWISANAPKQYEE